jgi:molybdopterin synthase catalytic subunit
VKVAVLYFAQARERAGCAREHLELPEGSRVEDARAAIARAHPGLEPLWPHLALALNGEIARDGMLVAPGAELALLPPVSGG